MIWMILAYGIWVQLIFQDESSEGIFGGISENTSKKVDLKQ